MGTYMFLIGFAAAATLGSKICTEMFVRNLLVESVIIKIICYSIYIICLDYY